MKFTLKFRKKKPKETSICKKKMTDFLKLFLNKLTNGRKIENWTKLFLYTSNFLIKIIKNEISKIKWKIKYTYLKLNENLIFKNKQKTYRVKFKKKILIKLEIVMKFEKKIQGKKFNKP